MNASFYPFPPNNTQEWTEKIIQELKGKSIESLQIPLSEGIVLSPFYTKDNLPPTLPTLHRSTPTWENIFAIEPTDFTQLSSFIADGATCFFWKVNNWQSLPTEAAKYAWILESETLPTDTVLLPSKSIVVCDFVAQHAAKGLVLETSHWHNLADRLRKNTSKETKLLGINGNIFHRAGANAVQEIGSILAMWVTYLDQLTDENIPIELLFQHSTFHLSVGTHYFLEIAKLRALRYLTHFIAQQYLTTFQGSFAIYAQGNLQNKATIDEHNNILRSTTETMSAVLGGAEGVMIPAFSQEDKAFARRISHNINLILKEEAHLDKVLDAVAGSYYLENLTQQVIEKSWDYFHQIEHKGGFLKVIAQNWLQKDIASEGGKQKNAIASGQKTWVGVNKYIPKDSNTKVQEWAIEPLHLF
ncbi:MAG: hypothetical protein EAZ55_04705 [Cytophagales bacterium]|nr:MAG: hypothetical protein EAZ55_04705 [Cytophagales bacterium]